MTRREFLKKYTARFLAALLLVGLIVYTVYHVLGSSEAGLMTVPAREVTDLRLTTGTAYLFRDEQVLSVDATGGVVNDLVKSGVKVSKNQALSRVFTEYQAMESEAVQQKLDALNRTIEVLERSIVSGGESLSHAEEYRAEAGALHLSMKEAILSGGWSELSDTSDEMLALLNRYDILTGRLQNADQLLQELQEERRALLKGEGVTVYSTNASGFFFDRSCVDGYESLYTLEALQSLTAESLDALKNSSPVWQENTTTAGKIVYGYTWYLAVETTGDSFDFVPGRAYEVRFPDAGARALSMTCERIAEDADGKLLVVLSSNDLPADFSYERVQSVELVVGSVVGYYVPESALVEQDGVEGVYIFKDSTVHFRRIEIIHRGDGYCIVAAKADQGADYLDLYDILITAGKNLYDGKVY